MMDKFISEHLYNKDIEVYFGGDGNQRPGAGSSAPLTAYWYWRTVEGETT